VTLEPGRSGRAVLVVDERDTASALGSGDVEVLATPRLISLCEEATLEALAARLPDFADRVGLILWGGRDFCFDDYFLSRWRALYPQAECVRYPEAGHYVLDD